MKEDKFNKITGNNIKVYCTKKSIIFVHKKTYHI
jgi:hypothetical protein